MMKTKIFLLAVAFPFFVTAQNTTKKSMSETEQAEMILVPFDPNFYMSDMDHEIGKKNQLESVQIREAFRVGLTRQLENAVSAGKSIKAIGVEEGRTGVKDAGEAIEGIKYEYVPLNTKKDQKKDTRIQKGQLGNSSAEPEKYMRATVSDQKKFEQLKTRYPSEKILFINQLEIRNLYGDAMDFQLGTYKRIMKVHYSIMDQSGKTIDGGIASTTFDNTVTDIDQIMKIAFPPICEEIKKKVIPPVPVQGK